MTDRFERLVAASSLLPIRLHDLRHGAAMLMLMLMLAAGIDVKIVSDTLGHSDTRITRDIYQSVLPHVGKSSAEATAKLVPLRCKSEAEKARKAVKAAQKAKEKAKAQAKAEKNQARKKPKKQSTEPLRSRIAHASRPTAPQPRDPSRPEQHKRPGHGRCDLAFEGAPCRIRTDDYALQDHEGSCPLMPRRAAE